MKLKKLNFSPQLNYNSDKDIFFEFIYKFKKISLSNITSKEIEKYINNKVNCNYNYNDILENLFENISILLRRIKFNNSNIAILPYGDKNLSKTSIYNLKYLDFLEDRLIDLIFI